MTTGETNEGLCPPGILVKFLRVLYGPQAAAEAQRRAEGRTASHEKDVRRLWLTVKGLLEARRNA